MLKKKRATDKIKEVKEQPHFIGHRERLRQRFRKSGGDGISEHELLEMILFRAVLRREVKPLAKRLLAHFGSFPAVIAADRDQLKMCPDIGDRIVDELHLIHTAIRFAMRPKMTQKPLLAHWENLFYYCQQHISYQAVECFYVLFLDTKYRLIEAERLYKVTINSTIAYPREIARHALRLNAVSVVLVHNHPSGDPEPSQADITLTEEIARALKAIDVKVHDHIIVARGKVASFHKLNLSRALNP